MGFCTPSVRPYERSVLVGCPLRPWSCTMYRNRKHYICAPSSLPSSLFLCFFRGFLYLTDLFH